jgi:O-antigen/teichoic acid export membrane protein
MRSDAGALGPHADADDGRGARDTSGRDRMAWNVVASWTGHGVFIVAGFVMPRFIDHTIGQEALGIWDFAWSLVSYFGLAEIGVGSSVGRYAARHRAAGDTAGLNRVVSSAMGAQLAAALIVLLLTAGVSLSLPALFGDRLGAYTAIAAPVVACLGAGLALQIAFDVYHGVIVGCHRWDLHNAINAGSYAATVTAMIATVLLGGGLRGLAAANLCGVVVAELTRRAVAYRICPELHLTRAAVDWTQLRGMIGFGLKSSVASVSRLVLFQGVSLIVASHLGPAALALYARPNALVRHAETLLNKFANILTPMASSLQATGRDA